MLTSEAAKQRIIHVLVVSLPRNASFDTSEHYDDWKFLFTSNRRYDWPIFGSISGGVSSDLHVLYGHVAGNIPFPLSSLGLDIDNWTRSFPNSTIYMLSSIFQSCASSCEDPVGDPVRKVSKKRLLTFHLTETSICARLVDNFPGH